MDGLDVVAVPVPDAPLAQPLPKANSGHRPGTPFSS